MRKISDSDKKQVQHIKFEREDTPTRSIWQRYKYELLVRHAKLTLGILLGTIIFFVISFVYIIFVYGVENWGLGFVGMFILLWDIIKWTAIGFWFVFSRGGWAILFAPLIYFFIKLFVHTEKVALKELGSKHRYWFKITTTSDGYLLHQDKLAGLLKKPIYLDKTTVQYFKENGTEQIDVETGKKNRHYLEVDIVPLYWKGDSLLIVDEKTGKRFLNNRIIITHEIRTLYSMVVKGLSPTDQEVEKTAIYEAVIGTNDLRQQLITAKHQLRNIIIERLELVLDVALPPTTEEYLRYKRVLDKATKPFDNVAEFERHKREMKELSSAQSTEQLDELMMMYYVEEEN